MKNLRTCVLCTCISLCGFIASAQPGKVIVNEPDYNKPRLFDNLPAEIPVSLENLDNLLHAKTGASIHTVLSTDAKTAPFDGQVVSAVMNDNDKVQTVFIRSTNYHGATLSLSRVMAEDGTTRYNGRLISFQHGDLYVLRPKDGGFVLLKKNFYELVNE